MGEKIGFGLYQSCWNRSVRRVSVWVVVVLGGCWGGVMFVCVVSLDFLCLCQVQVSVYYARRIPAHIRCTQCSILLHLIDICFLTCICMWQISQIQTFLGVVVVGSGVVSTLPFVRSSSSRLAQKTVNRDLLDGGRRVNTICTADYQTPVTDPPRVGCVVWSRWGWTSSS